MNIWLKGILVSAAVIGAIAVGAGCGSSGSSTSASSSGGDGSSSVDKATFVKQANAACLAEREKTMARVGVYENNHRGEGLSEAAMVQKAIKAAVLETLEGEIAALSKLQVPAGEEEEVEAVMASLRSAFDEAQKSNAKTSKDVENIFLPSDKVLREYGLTGCTKNT